MYSMQYQYNWQFISRKQRTAHHIIDRPAKK